MIIVCFDQIYIHLHDIKTIINQRLDSLADLP